MASITYRQVAKTYADGTEALHDFTLAIDDGELMAVVGPSGCGKSTALRMLAGLEAPTSGDILIDNQIVNDQTPQQRNVAMVFQNYALYPHMSVRRNLEFPLTMMKLPRAEIEQRTGRAAELLQLTELLERKPKQLSGGQRQRVAMGRAIVREPRVFLMDEPLSNLDAKLRVQIRTEIATLQRRMQTTTIYVTHDQVEAMTLGQRVAVMNAGRLQQVDVPQVLYDRPANSFVASFIGSPGMNLFTSSLQGAETGLALEFGGRWLDVPSNVAAGHAQLAAHVNQPIRAGLRPEAFSLASAPEASINVPIYAVEALGHEQLLYFEAPWSETGVMVARIDGNLALKVGDTIGLAVDTARLYFFDRQGNALYQS